MAAEIPAAGPPCKTELFHPFVQERYFSGPFLHDGVHRSARRGFDECS